MARIQFDDFDDAVFRMEMLCPPPLHPGAHTDNVQLLALAGQARAGFFAALGYREHDVEGARLFVGDQAVQYKAEAFPDQSVEMQMAVRNWLPKGFELIYRLVDAHSAAIITLGKIGMVCVDPSTKRPCAVPAILKAKIQALEPVAVLTAA